MRLPHNIKALPKNAFTLVELLMATALSSILILGLSMVFATVATQATRSESYHDYDREARAVMQLIAKDLRSLYRGNGSSIAMPFQLHNDGYSSAPASEIAFFATLPTQAQTSGQGDVCVVGYYLGVTQDGRGGGGSSSQKLFRIQKDSSATLATLKIATSGAASFSSDLIDDASTGIRSTPDDPENLGSGYWSTRKNFHEAIAYNVVDFQVVPLEVRTGALVPSTGYPTSSSGSYLVDSSSPNYPVALRVTLTLTNENFAAKLSSLADWRGAGSLGSFISSSGAGREVRTYQQTIFLD